MDNYFHFYKIEEKFFIDEVDLKNRYISISKENHPDYFISDDEKYTRALDISSINSVGFKTLSSFRRRVPYILKLNNILGEVDSKIPQEFLIEMMDINETIMDLKMDFDRKKLDAITSDIDILESNLNLEMTNYSKLADSQESKFHLRKGHLKACKEIYLKLKYVLRIKESLNTFAAE